jgi:hypothetical protein
MSGNTNSDSSDEQKKEKPFRVTITEPIEHFIDKNVNSDNSNDSEELSDIIPMKYNSTENMFTKKMSDLVRDELKKKEEEMELRIIKTLKNDMQDDDDDDIIRFKDNAKEYRDTEVTEESTESQSTARKRLKKKILEEYIYPDDEETLKTLLTDRKNYAFLLQVIRIVRIVTIMVIVPVLVFSDAAFTGYHLNYVGGVLAVVGGGFEIIDKVIVQNNKKRREKINLLLDSLGIKYRVPDTTLDDPTALEASRRKSTVTPPPNYHRKSVFA